MIANRNEINRRRYQDGFGKMQYLKYLKDNVGDAGNRVQQDISVDNKSSDIDNVLNQVSVLKEQNNSLSNKLDYIIEKFESYEDEAPVASDISNTEIAVYDANASTMQKGDEYWEEKPKLFGGTKMVKKTVK